MADSTSTVGESQDSRPKLRCPRCSFMVPLPAETCPRCGTNLRTGEMPAADEEPSANRLKIIIGLLALCAIAVLAFFLFTGNKEEVKPSQQASPAKTADDVGEAVGILNELPHQGSIGYQPGAAVRQGKDAAEKWEEKRRDMDEVFNATE